jgi:hypothetical protein
MLCLASTLLYSGLKSSGFCIRVVRYNGWRSVITLHEGSLQLGSSYEHSFPFAFGDSDMHNQKRFIGKVVLFWNNQNLPTNFFMDLQKGRCIFIAETEMPHGMAKKSSLPEQLTDLLRQHRSNVEKEEKYVAETSS